ncbi:MAG: ribonuclease P protein component [Actinomycetota bacterium]
MWFDRWEERWCSVTRHRISRQLRHLLHDRLEEIPKGSFVVVRALANSAKVSAAELKNQFTSTLTKLIEKSSVAQ